MSKRILIADDEPNIVAAVEYLLKRSGYEVSVARNGAEALELVETSHPDLVVLDVMMPVKSGYEVCVRMRERRGARAMVTDTLEVGVEIEHGPKSNPSRPRS